MVPDNQTDIMNAQGFLSIGDINDIIAHISPLISSNVSSDCPSIIH
jgi:hypothetical protein